jgi:hypothetical protein
MSTRCLLLKFAIALGLVAALALVIPAVRAGGGVVALVQNALVAVETVVAAPLARTGVLGAVALAREALLVLALVRGRSIAGKVGSGRRGRKAGKKLATDAHRLKLGLVLVARGGFADVEDPEVRGGAGGEEEAGVSRVGERGEATFMLLYVDAGKNRQ